MKKQLMEVLQEKENPLFHLVNRQQVKEVLGGEYPWPWYGQLMRRPQTIAFLLQLEYWLRYYDVRLKF